MLFEYFFSFSLSAIFGFDFGSENIKIARLTKNGVEISLNEQSKRVSPAYFAFWNISDPNYSNTSKHWKIDQLSDFDWSFFDSAKSHFLRFPSNSIKGLRNILSNEHGFTRRESSAIIIRHLLNTVENGRWNADSAEIVFSVEPYTTRKERHAIYEAIKLSGANPSAIIDAPSAAAYYYALEKHHLFSNRDRTVAFIDIGATATWIALFKFHKPNVLKSELPYAEEISIVRNETLGGNLIDQKLSDFIYSKIQNYLIQINLKQSNSHINLDSPKIKNRILEEARKAKEILSINSKVQIKIDDIYEFDENSSYNLLEDVNQKSIEITRSDFNFIIQEFNSSLTNLFNQFLNISKINYEGIDSIELVGGTTRVPFIQNILLELSHLKKLNRTMNSDEAIALGACYKAASQSNVFSMKKFILSPFCNSKIILKHYSNNQSRKTQLFTQNLFLETSRLNESANYSFDLYDNGNFSVYEKDDELYSFHFDTPLNSTKASLIFSFDQFTQPILSKLLIDNVVVDIPVFYQTPNYYLSPKKFKKSFNFIRKMEEISNQRKEFAKILDKYESFIYEIKDKLERDQIFLNVITTSDKEKILSIINSHSQKIIDFHEKKNNKFKNDLQKSIKTIKSDFNELKSSCDKGLYRENEYKKRESIRNNFIKISENIEHLFIKTKPLLENINDQTSKNPHSNKDNQNNKDNSLILTILNSKVNILKNTYSEGKQKFNDYEKMIKNLKLTEDPTIKTNDMEKMIEKLGKKLEETQKTLENWNKQQQELNEEIRIKQLQMEANNPEEKHTDDNEEFDFINSNIQFEESEWVHSGEL